ncbi:MAG: plastocyanin/azurin family copper-binding protein [Actinomycetota bacterium]
MQMPQPRHLLGPAVLLVALAVPPAAGAANRDVQVRDFSFRADYVRVDPGDTVTWRFVTGLHSATSRGSAPAAFDSDLSDPGESYSFAFQQPGRYDYFCSVHPTLMNGVVQVGPDLVRPKLSRLRATVGARTVRLGYRLSEDAKVVAKIARRGRTVKTIRSSRFRDGTQSVTYRAARLVPGRYRATLTARDREGNAARPVRVSFTVRASG